MSPYRIAIDSTTDTIEQRAKNYRNLVVVVVFIFASSIAWALIAWQLQAFTSLILLLPICGLFFFLDSKLLNQWRSRILAPWVKKELELYYFLDAVSAISTLPKATVKSMLDTLPASEDILKEQKLSSATREAIATVISTLDACRADVLAFKTATFTVAVFSIIAATFLWLWEPMLGLLSLLLLILANKEAKRWRLKENQKTLLFVRQKPEFDEYAYREYGLALDWGFVIESDKEALLAIDRSPESSIHPNSVSSKNELNI